MKIMQSYFYHKDTRKMQLANFLYVHGYTVMQVCLDRLLRKLIWRLYAERSLVQ